jgi:hypothetical protein
VKDTNLLKEFELRRFSKYTIKRMSLTRIEWREVLCGDKVFVLTIRQIQESLRKEGYYHDITDGVMNAQMKNALSKYQREKGLPVGYLDFETLDALSIRY